MVADAQFASSTVVVLRGGNASEREVSLRSGAAVLMALSQVGIETEDWVVESMSEVIAKVQAMTKPFIVFNAMHGKGGEDGQLQGLLDVLGVVYTGSGRVSSTLAMDKIITKRIWQSMGLPTADYWVLTKDNHQSILARSNIPFPVIVKPACEGSSIGMQRAGNRQELQKAITEALEYDDQVLVERWIHGAEYTVAILGAQVLPVIRLKTPHAFYDFQAKYQTNTTEYLCPCGLSDEQEQQLQHLALLAFKGIGAKVWGRVDVMVDHEGQPWLLELNTVPGMTDHSLVPMAAKAAGIGFVDLIKRILTISYECA